jgi:predicted nucleic acid-binding protein
MRPEPTPTVAAWIADRDTEELSLRAVSEAELLYGVAIMPTSGRRNALEVAMSRWVDLGFADRILPLNSSVTRAYAVIASARRSRVRDLARLGSIRQAIAGSSPASRTMLFVSR